MPVRMTHARAADTRRRAMEALSKLETPMTENEKRMWSLVAHDVPLLLAAWETAEAECERLSAEQLGVSA